MPHVVVKMIAGGSSKDPAITIRPTTRADVATLGRLGALLVRTHHDFGGHGVGRLLLDAAITALAERGAPRVLLSTAERNDAAQRLFERAGFRRTMIEMTREIDGDAI